MDITKGDLGLAWLRSTKTWEMNSLTGRAQGLQDSSGGLRTGLLLGLRIQSRQATFWKNW